MLHQTLNISYFHFCFYIFAKYFCRVERFNNDHTINHQRNVTLDLSEQTFLGVLILKTIKCLMKICLMKSCRSEQIKIKAVFNAILQVFIFEFCLITRFLASKKNASLMHRKKQK